MTTPTPPIPGFTSATPVASPNYWSIQITGTAQGVEIAQALGAAVAAGVITNGTTVVNKQNGAVFWQVSITDVGGKTTFATTGDWLVVGTDTAGAVTSLALYDGTGPYNNPPYIGAFQ